MLMNTSRNCPVLFKNWHATLSNFAVRSVYSDFRRDASNNPKSSVADDAKTEDTDHHHEVQRCSPSPSLKVLYDGECNICMHEIRVLQSIAKKKPVDFVDINTPEFTADAFRGVTYEMAMKEMHVIGKDGKVYTQGDAIREMYRGCGLGWLAATTQLPGIKGACDAMYVKFAEYRLRKSLDRCDAGTSCSIKLKHLRDKLRPLQEKS